MAFFNPMAEFFDPMYAIFAAIQIFYNILLLSALITMAIMFFRKHYMFPGLFIAISIFNIVYFPVSSLLFGLLLEGPPEMPEAMMREFYRTCLAAMIWVPYMLRSKRVKRTFVHGRRSAA